MAHQRLQGIQYQVASLVLSGLGVAAAVVSWRMGLWTLGSPDAGLLPFVASVLLALLAGAAAFVPASEAVRLDAAAWRRLASYGAAMLVLCTWPLLTGCTVAFAAALFLAMRGAEQLPARAALGWSLAMSVACVLLFRRVLGVPLPDPVLDRLLGL